MVFNTATFTYQLEHQRYSCWGRDGIHLLDPCFPTAARQAQLKSYGFSCTCLSCCPYPSSNVRDESRRTSIPARVDALFRNWINSRQIRKSLEGYTMPQYRYYMTWNRKGWKGTRCTVKLWRNALLCP
ncbi:hypothetical protein BDQ17DRAFT_367376 [Cyathus striatus]|nr:hypothetical protein BDQ17DRAFT_367376 [Cyathus striatus]